jgi:hypothetical protein
MVKSDTTNRYNGLIQRCEDDCGLGATGITSNAALYSQFIGWLNQWNKTGASLAIMAWGGADFDDKGYTTKPSGTFVGTTNRDYNFDESYKLMKIKLVQVSYDGINYVPAKPFDASDYECLATKDPNVDSRFSTSNPKYDERADGFDLYPLFTAAQVAAGAKVYMEWFRAPQEWDTTTGTDTVEPSLDLQFHHFPAVGASYEYAKLYKPQLAVSLQGDLYGARTARGQLIKTGVIADIQDWYVAKNRLPARVRVKRRLKI